jgi:CheY-like chemotaxis protein
VPQTLLLVDDSVTIQRVIELTFAGEAIDVVAVGSVDEAIRRLESSPPDIVLADVGMPGRNGYEVARHIKETPHLAHVPVVLLTGTFDPVDQARATASGADAVLVKPFEPQQVIARVKELLGGRPGQAALDRYFERLDRELNLLAASAPSSQGRGRGAESDEPSPSGAPPAAPANRLPSLADAFAALLEAERHEPALDGWWPGASARPAACEEAVERIVQDVLRRLSEQSVRSRIDEIVTTVAERLVREEIERIKSSIT